MASIHVVTRPLRGGGERFHVRMTSGRYDPIIHLGAYPSETAATNAAARARLMLDEGVTPSRELLARHRVTHQRITVQAAYEAWIASRIDISDNTRATYKTLARHVVKAFGPRDVRSLTPPEVQAWIIRLTTDGVQPRSVPAYRRVLGQILDHARVTPNPANDDHVYNPRSEPAEFRLPTSRDLVALYAALTPNSRVVVELLEHTGLRVSEAASLRWEDRDQAARRLRVTKSKTSAGRRFIDDLDYPANLVELLNTPPAERGVSTYILDGRSAKAIAGVIRHGCIRAKIPGFSPHDFRHLHASRLVRAGWDPVRVAARLGHTRSSMTLDTYSHVIAPD